ncbi:LuxR C-terminal-related transcriptional regulator [Streptomyces sp. NPDC002520]
MAHSGTHQGRARPAITGQTPVRPPAAADHAAAGDRRDMAGNFRPPVAQDTSTVTVLTDDPIVRLAVISHVRQRPELVLSAPGDSADLAVAVLRDPDTEALTRLSQHVAGNTLVVLIVEGEWRADVHVALAARVRAVLFRSGFTWNRFDEAVQQVRFGHDDLPAVLQGRLKNQLERSQQLVPAPRGLTPEGLTLREAEVLRLVAEGHELQDIGAQLGYSERTIKNVLHGISKRHGLRNRAHAVAYAIRRRLI